jgi:NAD(P)-dependent dehydrogenase (short-subunit alcohol dehydrogenase family)
MLPRLPLSAQHKGIVGVKMDVTQPDQVQAVADQVAAENPKGLYALVNNAGRS